MNPQTDMTAAEALRIFKRLSDDAEWAQRKVNRPGKRPSAAEKEAARQTARAAQARLDAFVLAVDPEEAGRGMRPAVVAHAEEDALLERFGF